MAVDAMRHNIKICPTIQCKFLLILKMGVPLSVPTGCNVLNSAYPFSGYDLLIYLPICGSKQNCGIVLVLKKTNKNIVAGWNFWLVFMNDRT